MQWQCDEDYLGVNLFTVVANIHISWHYMLYKMLQISEHNKVNNNIHMIANQQICHDKFDKIFCTRNDLCYLWYLER